MLNGVIGKGLLATGALLALTLSACASSRPEQAPGEVVGDAVQQPFRDLNLIRDRAPATLEDAAQAPYNRDGLPDCPTLMAEVDELDQLLGKDIDAGVDKGDSDAVQIASDAVRSLFDLPFRGVIRRITGAHERDEAIRRAILAGMVRRGYLKGLAEERGCLAG